jgi:beta-lactamase superfamily II metal-dependent hydrolase
VIRIAMLPAADGDCILVDTEGAHGRHRMLIDGGRSNTAAQFLTPAIQGRRIDLAVLTHFDADHIEGLLDLLGQAQHPEVGEVWFNGWRQLQEARDRRKRRTRVENDEPVLNALQGRTFGQLIAQQGHPWNVAFGGGPALTPDEGELPRVKLGSGATLVLLGPSVEKLVLVSKIWERECLAFGLKPEEFLGKIFRPPTLATIRDRATMLDVADDKPANGSSIVFVLEHEKRRILFGADAHPDDLGRALRRYQPGPGRIYFDAVKVPHHGAARNCTSQLIDLIESPRWLISTTGARHKHPDPEAICRIILTPIDGKQLVFNWRGEYNEIWSDRAIQKAYNYVAVYPEAEDFGGVCHFSSRNGC